MCTSTHTHIFLIWKPVLYLLSDGSESESVSTTVSLGGGSFSANKSRPDLKVSTRESCWFLASILQFGHTRFFLFQKANISFHKLNENWPHVIITQNLWIIQKCKSIRISNFLSHIKGSPNFYNPGTPLGTQGIISDNLSHKMLPHFVYRMSKIDCTAYSDRQCEP